MYICNEPGGRAEHPPISEWPTTSALCHWSHAAVIDYKAEGEETGQERTRNIMPTEKRKNKRAQ